MTPYETRESDAAKAFGRIRAHWPTVLVFLLGIASTLALWRAEVSEERQIAATKFEANIQGLHKAMKARMLAYEQILRGGVSLFNTMGTVSREQWATYVGGLDVQTNFPGIQGLGFAQHVPLSKKAEFIQQIRAQGLPDYDIRPAGQRNEFGPVTYLEPSSKRNLGALGFDMMSEPTRQEAMSQARDSAKPALTAKLRLASEPNQSPAVGFLVYLPVYQPGMATDTIENRRLALRGFVNSPFRIDDLMDGIVERYADSIRLRIFDGSTISPQNLMYDRQGGRRPVETLSDPSSDTAPVTTLAMQFENRSWTLVFSAPQVPNAKLDVMPVLFLSMGTVISLLLSALMYSFSDRVRLVRNSEQHYFKLANYDALTGLPNRTMFLDRLQHSLHQAHREHRKFALVFADLDRFKDINDNLGHHVGDELLKQVALRLRSCLRQADTLARLGGDEFTAILHDMQEQGDAGLVAQTILRKMNEPYTLFGREQLISMSIGITIYPDDSSEAQDLLKNADQAMYSAKQRGRNQFQYFSDEMQNAVRVRLQMIDQLRIALERNEFSVVYQPIVELSSGEIHKAEALIRWSNPEFGSVGPAVFISVAEEAGLIHRIGNWVFEEASKQSAIWRATYRADFQISVNVSPAQFRPPPVGHANCLDRSPYLLSSGPGVVVEITEGLLLNIEGDVTKQLIALRDCGIQVALDDFGTGYSSLSYLRKLDIDYLKIDKSFVNSLEADSEDLALCSAIIVMAHKLGLKVIAEGVETQAQRDLLQGAGCDFGQGYLFSKPVTPELFETLIQRTSDVYLDLELTPFRGYLIV